MAIVPVILGSTGELYISIYKEALVGRYKGITVFQRRTALSTPLPSDAIANSTQVKFALIVAILPTEPARQPTCAMQPTGTRSPRAQFATRTAESVPTKIPDECDAATIGRRP